MRAPFKRFVGDLLEQEVEELEVNEYFNPPETNESREKPEVSEDDSVEMAKIFNPILHQSMAAKVKGSTQFRLKVFEEECEP